MIENPAFTLSDIAPEKRIPPFLRLKSYVKQLSDEIGLDPDSYESLRMFANVYFRLNDITRDFQDQSLQFTGYPLEYDQDNYPAGGHYYYITRDDYEDTKALLSRTAFDIYDTRLSGSEAIKVAVYRVIEFVHLLNN